MSESPVDRAASDRVIARMKAWDRFLANEVEPTMGWVHVAFNEGFQAGVLAAAGSCEEEG
jgi:hypothetical protein